MLEKIYLTDAVANQSGGSSEADQWDPTYAFLHSELSDQVVKRFVTMLRKADGVCTYSLTVVKRTDDDREMELKRAVCKELYVALSAAAACPLHYPVSQRRYYFQWQDRQYALTEHLSPPLPLPLPLPEPDVEPVTVPPSDGTGYSDGVAPEGAHGNVWFLRTPEVEASAESAATVIVPPFLGVGSVVRGETWSTHRLSLR